MPARINYEESCEAFRSGTISESVFYVRTRDAFRRGNPLAAEQLRRNGWRTPSPRRQRAMRRAVAQVLNRVRARKFGIEIEFTGDAAAVVAEAQRLGLSVSAESYNHTVRSHWKIVRDGSCGNELVSPPLANEPASFEQIKLACRALQAAACRVNANCGLHVHIEVPNLSADELRAIIQSYTKNQPVINNVLSRSRRQNTYATSWQAHELAAIARDSDVRSIASRIVTRYKTVNVHSYSRYGTIEFRQHQGSSNYSKIAAWIRFCYALTNVTRELDVANNIEALTQALNLSAEDRAYFNERAMELA